MKSLLAVFFATMYGIIMRALFGIMGDIWGVMSLTFLIFVPVLFGYLSVLLSPADKITSKGSAFFWPWLTGLVLLVATILIHLEGFICWVMLYPIFGVMAGVGGLIAYHFKTKEPDSENYPIDSNKNDWGDPNRMNISLIVLIPLLLGAFEGEKALSPEYITIERERIVEASPAEVWQRILYKSEADIQKKSTPFSTFLGFPRHVRTEMGSLAVGAQRMVYYEKGLYFEETVRSFEPEKQLVLSIKTDPTKIPPNVMDEHILIGGKHLDILEDVYTLEKMQDGTTKVHFSSHFFINTPFNWYARFWAKWLMVDILDGELDLIEAVNQ